jgi:hypothetical protein
VQIIGLGTQSYYVKNTFFQSPIESEEVEKKPKDLGEKNHPRN